MNNEEFIKLVAKMRAAQRRFFRTNNYSQDLPEAKRLEKEVDHFLDEYLNGPDLLNMGGGQNG